MLTICRVIDAHSQGNTVLIGTKIVKTLTLDNSN